jgi:hypothetical protein
MWWNRPDKKKEDDRARTEMELALARFRGDPTRMPTWDEVKAKMDFEYEQRVIEYTTRETRRQLLDTIVPYLASTGQISNYEYSKYLLDETGTYMPKPIKDE